MSPSRLALSDVQVISAVPLVYQAAVMGPHGGSIMKG